MGDNVTDGREPVNKEIGESEEIMKLYSSTAVSDLIDRYLEAGGDVETISEGVLGHGHIVLTGPGLKRAVIKERYINAWSSGHSVRMYNR